MNKELKKYPTEQEVCETISKEFNNVKVYFEDGQFCFKNKYGNEIVVLNYLTDSPHLIIMVGEFFKGKQQKWA